MQTLLPASHWARGRDYTHTRTHTCTYSVHVHTYYTHTHMQHTCTHTSCRQQHCVKASEKKGDQLEVVPFCFGYASI